MARPIVIDANASLSLFFQLPYSNRMDRRMQEWQAEETHIIVPILWEYECLSGLRRAVTLKLISATDARLIANDLLALEFERVAPIPEVHQSALQWAERLKQSKVYDAQYVALAESRSAEFWSADERLIHGLKALGVDWAFAI